MVQSHIDVVMLYTVFFVVSHYNLFPKSFGQIINQYSLAFLIHKLAHRTFDYNRLYQNEATNNY